MKFYLISAIAIAIANRALAQQSRDTARTEPVVVTATRTPVSRGALPVAVTVLNGDDLRRRGVETVADALSDLPSASVVRSGSEGATTSLFLRGGESKYVKVLIDGVPANEPGGAYDFASLSLDNVERIEIVRGPTSVLYGADAVTGVVQIFTRHGAGAPSGDVELRTGIAERDVVDPTRPEPAPMRTVDLSAGMRGATAAASYAVAVARHLSTGLYDQNNDYGNSVLSARVGFSPDSRTDLRLALRYNDYQYNYPTDGSGAVVDRNAYRTDDRTIVGVELERRLTAQVRSVLSLSSSLSDGGTDDRFDPGATDGSSYVSQDRIRRRGAELRVHVVPGSRFLLTAGGQIEQQDQRSQSQSLAVFGGTTFGPFLTDFKAARRNTAGYAEALVLAGSRLSMTLGARVDDNEQFGTFGTGRAGAAWHPFAGTRLRATAGNAFREPSFFENYSVGVVTGNPELRPEHTRSVDAGIEQDVLGGRARIGLTGFAQHFRDMIDYSSKVGCAYDYCNIAEARSNGAEAELRADLPGPFRGGVAGTVLRTRVLVPGAQLTGGDLYKPGEPLIRRPEHKWTGDLSYDGPGPLTAALRVMIVGQRVDRDFRTFPFSGIVVPGYTRIDLGGAWALDLPGVRTSSVTFRVENLADARYQEVFNYLAPRRTVAAGVRSTF